MLLIEYSLIYGPKLMKVLILLRSDFSRKMDLLVDQNQILNI